MREYTVTVAFKLQKENAAEARQAVSDIVKSTECAELDHIEWDIVSTKDEKGLQQ